MTNRLILGAIVGDVIDSDYEINNVKASKYLVSVYIVSTLLTGGKRKVIDETFRDTAKFKDDIESEVTEQLINASFSTQKRGKSTNLPLFNQI